MKMMRQMTLAHVSCTLLAVIFNSVAIITIDASVSNSGYTVVDAVAGARGTVNLVSEPATDSDYKTACVNSALICPRITAVPLLQLDLQITGPVNLQAASYSQLSSTQSANGAKYAFYIYDYDAQVIDECYIRGYFIQFLFFCLKVEDVPIMI